MTDKFYVWFWNRRDSTDKALITIIPIDALFVIGMLFTSIPGLGILVLTMMLTVVSLGVFKILEFIFKEHNAFREAREREAELIVQKLRGDEPKNANSVLEQLKAYKAAATISKTKMTP